MPPRSFLRSAQLLLLLAHSAIGCASTPPSATTSASSPAPAPAAPAAASETAPTPYSAQQIRAATRPGRTYEFRVEAEGKPTLRRVITFVSADDTQGEMKVRVLDPSGKVLDDAPPKTVTWEELRKHAEFPRAQVAISEATTTVPAGTFACVVYTVTEGSGADARIERYYFAKDLPGAPVLFFTEQGGRRVMTSTLVAHRPGS